MMGYQAGGKLMGKTKHGRCEFCMSVTTVERKQKYGHLIWLCKDCQ